MKEVYLIRHTTPDVEKGICYGMSNLNVDANFDAEALSIKKIIEDFKPESVFSSPLIRCSKLATSLFPGADIHFDDRLKEMNFGDWEMKAWSSINKDIMKRWSADYINIPTPNGENFNQLYQRACAFIDEQTSSTKKNKHIAVVTHSGIMRCLISRYLGIPLTKIFSLKLNYGAIVKITLHEDFEEVEFIG